MLIICKRFLTADVQELVFVIWFGIEFAVRVWSAGYRSRYRQVSGRLRFIRRPLCIVGKSKQFSCSLSPFQNLYICRHPRDKNIHCDQYGFNNN